MESEIKKAEDRLTTTMGALRAWEGNPYHTRDPREALTALRQAITQADKTLQDAAANPRTDVLEVRHLTAMRELATGTLKAFEQRRR